jgi:hypothetical protein
MSNKIDDAVITLLQGMAIAIAFTCVLAAPAQLMMG